MKMLLLLLLLLLLLKKKEKTIHSETLFTIPIELKST